MFEIVAYIAQLFAGGGEAAEDPGDLRDQLLESGFPEDDVERTVSWLLRLRNRRDSDPALMSLPSSAVRQPSGEEAIRIAPEARGLLLRLERGGLLPAPLREAVYEKAATLDLAEVGVEEIRVLLALVFHACVRGGERLAARLLAGEVEGFHH